MRRSILTSFVLIGAVLALVAGASTFAVFTDEDAIEGTITAGTINVDLADIGDSPEEATLTFDLTSVCGEMTPEDTCDVDIQICNGTTTATVCAATGSNLEGTVTTGTVTESADPDSCFSGDITGAAPVSIGDGAVGDTGAADTATFTTTETPDGDGAPHDDSLDPGESVTVTLTVSLDDDDACQGDSVTYAVDVTLSQSSSPHD